MMICHILASKLADVQIKSIKKLNKCCICLANKRVTSIKKMCCSLLCKSKIHKYGSLKNKAWHLSLLAVIVLNLNRITSLACGYSEKKKNKKKIIPSSWIITQISIWKTLELNTEAINNMSLHACSAINNCTSTLTIYADT